MAEQMASITNVKKLVLHICLAVNSFLIAEFQSCWKLNNLMTTWNLTRQFALNAAENRGIMFEPVSDPKTIEKIVGSFLYQDPYFWPTVIEMEDLKLLPWNTIQLVPDLAKRADNAEDKEAIWCIEKVLVYYNWDPSGDEEVLGSDDEEPPKGAKKVKVKKVKVKAALVGTGDPKEKKPKMVKGNKHK